MYITLVNHRTDELKNIKVGFSWVLFLFSSMLDIPLFLRRLHVWGAIFLAFTHYAVIPFVDMSTARVTRCQISVRPGISWFAVIPVGSPGCCVAAAT